MSFPFQCRLTASYQINYVKCTFRLVNVIFGSLFGFAKTFLILASNFCDLLNGESEQETFFEEFSSGFANYSVLSGFACRFLASFFCHPSYFGCLYFRKIFFACPKIRLNFEFEASSQVVFVEILAVLEESGAMIRRGWQICVDLDV